MGREEEIKPYKEGEGNEKRRKGIEKEGKRRRNRRRKGMNEK